jgi:hypothetical protein
MPFKFQGISLTLMSLELKKGTTHGLVCDTKNWLMLNSSASRSVGKSAAMEPSCQCEPCGWYATTSPRLFFALSSTGSYTPGMAQDASTAV